MQKRRRREDRNVRAGVLNPAVKASIYGEKVAVIKPLKWRKMRPKIWPLRA